MCRLIMGGIGHREHTVFLSDLLFYRREGEFPKRSMEWDKHFPSGRPWTKTASLFNVSTSALKVPKHRLGRKNRECGCRTAALRPRDGCHREEWLHLFHVSWEEVLVRWMGNCRETDNRAWVKELIPDPQTCQNMKPVASVWVSNNYCC